MQQADETGITVNVKINPLIWFSWGGFILLLIGTALAAWPKKGGAVAPVPGPCKPTPVKASSGKRAKR